MGQPVPDQRTHMTRGGGRRMSTGYSGTPLVKKLGIKPGFRVFVDNAPENYLQLLEPLPDQITFVAKIESDLDLIHIFADRKKDLAAKLKRYVKKIKANG